MNPQLLTNSIDYKHIYINTNELDKDKHIFRSEPIDKFTYTGTSSGGTYPSFTFLGLRQLPSGR